MFAFTGSTAIEIAPAPWTVCQFAPPSDDFRMPLAVAAKTLIVRGKVEDLTPGSRAKRYLAGFGAGAAGTKFSGEIVDAKSGEVLARFTQERRSGGTFKFAGGNDMDVMRDAIHASGKDIAHILDAFN